MFTISSILYFQISIKFFIEIYIYKMMFTKFMFTKWCLRNSISKILQNSCLQNSCLQNSCVEKFYWILKFYLVYLHEIFFQKYVLWKFFLLNIEILPRIPIRGIFPKVDTKIYCDDKFFTLYKFIQDKYLVNYLFLSKRFYWNLKPSWNIFDNEIWKSIFHLKRFLLKSKNIISSKP